MNVKDCNKLVRKYIQEQRFQRFLATYHQIELLDTFVYSFTTEYNTKSLVKIHHGFGVTFSQLQNMFGN